LVGRVAAKALSARQVESEERVGYHADGSNTGLYLQVVAGRSGVKRSWIYRYTSPTTKKRREVGLGPTSVRKLADARAVATEYRLRVLSGVDPKDERDRTSAQLAAARAKQIPFDQAVRDCIKAKAPEWRNAKHAQQWANSLAAYACPTLGKLPVDSITTELVYEVLEPIWGKKTETATRVRQRIEVVWDWSKARGYCSGDNPARLKGALGQLLPSSQKIKKIQHHAAVHYTQVYDFVRELRTKKGVAPLALEFALLTAARTGEVVAARWDEIDLVAKVWTVPGVRMKAGREHRVPLCNRAVEILQTMQAAQTNDFVFSGHSSGKHPHLSTGAFSAVMKRMGQYAQYTPHGLRSTFRDWGSEKTQFPNETLELALAHTIKNKAEAAYRRQDQLDKRFKLMQLWQSFVETAPGAQVPQGQRRSSRGQK
jgi:integrase